MAVWMIDGEIEDIEPGRSGWGSIQFRNVTFRTADGQSEHFDRLDTASELGERLQSGLSGRFYLFRSLGQGGIHGYRGADGDGVEAYPMSNIRIFTVLFVLMVPTTIYNWYTYGIGYIPTAICLLVAVTAAIMLPYQLRSRSEAAAQFANDDYRAPPTAT